jgi:hypothetical protein
LKGISRLGAKETVRLPALDRIFSIKEEKGITGVLCAVQPCTIEYAAPIKQAASKGEKR